MQARNQTLDSFLAGVLTVAVASPCTAPFMGASLGLAVSLPTLDALLVFAMLGLGMALPYLIISLVPAAARMLPRPGPWMNVFRTLLAFPMFGTVVWLVWVLGQQSGIDGAGALLALLVALSALVWTLTLAGRTRVLLAGITFAFLAAGVYSLGSNIAKPPELAPAVAAGERWQPWQPGKVDQILASGRPVFVDFTAAWCVTCQINKKRTLANTELLRQMDERHVALLRADWTRRDPAISFALSQLGRNGVPVYVMYQAGRAPVVLSEVLSLGDMQSVLARL
jgi:thiol:disulfide interchange protein DsbD